VYIVASRAQTESFQIAFKMSKQKKTKATKPGKIIPFLAEVHVTILLWIHRCIVSS